MRFAVKSEGFSSLQPSAQRPFHGMHLSVVFPLRLQAFARMSSVSVDRLLTHLYFLGASGHLPAFQIPWLGNDTNSLTSFPCQNCLASEMDVSPIVISLLHVHVN